MAPLRPYIRAVENLLNKFRLVSAENLQQDTMKLKFYNKKTIWLVLHIEKGSPSGHVGMDFSEQINSISKVNVR